MTIVLDFMGGHHRPFGLISLQKYTKSGLYVSPLPHHQRCSSSPAHQEGSRKANQTIRTWNQGRLPNRADNRLASSCVVLLARFSNAHNRCAWYVPFNYFAQRSHPGDNLGSPNIWTNSNPSRVAADSGLVYIDQNAHRMGFSASPLTPIFAAIDDLGGYDFSGLDLVSDRNNLRKLFRWATGVADEKDFRIDIELAGKTCLFTRREEKDAETIIGFKGFGHNYEKAATRPAPGCETATGHHRIIAIVTSMLMSHTPN
jgi:hypothetical protein